MSDDLKEPKRPISAFLMFVKEKRADFKAAGRETTLSTTEVWALWQALDIGAKTVRRGGWHERSARALTPSPCALACRRTLRARKC